MIARLKSLIRKEFIQTFRDLPIVFLAIYTFAEVVLCGWALTMDVKHLPTAVLDRDNSPASRALLGRFRQAEAFDLNFYPANEAELERLLDSGQASLGLIIPPGFSRDLASGQPTQLQVLADGTQTNPALLSLGYINQIARGYSSEIEVQRLNQSGQAVFYSNRPSVINNIRAWYVPEMRYIHFNAISMVSLAVVLLGVLLAAAGIVREKEAGTLEQLMVTPIRLFELILAKVIPLIALELVGLITGVGLSFFVFGVAPHGNLFGSLSIFVAVTTLAVLASTGIGIWIATYARNLMQALLMAFFILFPMLFLSGTITPVSAMPGWLQSIAFLSPMTHYLSLALNIFLKGVNLSVTWSHAAILAGFTVFILWVALNRFRRSLS
ncbi:MAG: ABC transporter permease [Chloroflexi bacterium]|nr:ABC transporter permease [Chloroflexota bacterium]MBI3339003.1 ABC transporter permease [Chloroflexota bacterium]